MYGSVTRGHVNRTGQFLNILCSFQAESGKCYRVRGGLQPEKDNHTFPINPRPKRVHQSKPVSKFSVQVQDQRGLRAYREHL